MDKEAFCEKKKKKQTKAEVIMFFLVLQDTVKITKHLSK